MTHTYHIRESKKAAVEARAAIVRTKRWHSMGCPLAIATATEQAVLGLSAAFRHDRLAEHKKAAE